MDTKLIQAFKTKNYDYILARLKPLFYRHLKGISPEQQEDYLQEYCIVCVQVVKNFEFENVKS